MPNPKTRQTNTISVKYKKREVTLTLIGNVRTMNIADIRKEINAPPHNLGVPTSAQAWVGQWHATSEGVCVNAGQHVKFK